MDLVSMVGQIAGSDRCGRPLPEISTIVVSMVAARSSELLSDQFEVRRKVWSANRLVGDISCWLELLIWRFGESVLVIDPSMK